MANPRRNFAASTRFSENSLQPLSGADLNFTSFKIFKCRLVRRHKVFVPPISIPKTADFLIEPRLNLSAEAGIIKGEMAGVIPSFFQTRERPCASAGGWAL